MTELTYVSSPNSYYQKTAELRLRPVPEMGFCLIFVPSGPQLLTLNTTAWLVLELCDGADQESIIQGYHRQLEPLLTVDEVREQVSAALDDLITLKLVEVGGSRAS
jgi:hypothetical protein